MTDQEQPVPTDGGPSAAWRRFCAEREQAEKPNNVNQPVELDTAFFGVERRQLAAAVTAAIIAEEDAKILALSAEAVRRDEDEDLLRIFRALSDAGPPADAVPGQLTRAAFKEACEDIKRRYVAEGQPVV